MQVPGVWLLASSAVGITRVLVEPPGWCLGAAAAEQMGGTQAAGRHSKWRPHCEQKPDFGKRQARLDVRTGQGATGAQNGAQGRAAGAGAHVRGPHARPDTQQWLEMGVP